MKILFFDAETTPLTAHTWGLWDQNISLGQLLESTQMMCFGARWFGQSKVIFRSTHHHGKAKMLEDLHALMDEADVICGWNSAGFDHKHIRREFLEAGMLPPSPTKDLDLMRVVKAQFRFPSNKLDYVAQRLGVGAKVKHSGFDLWIKCMAGDPKAWKEMKVYQVQDVDLLVDLYVILRPWIKNHPSVPLHNYSEDGCTACGSLKLQKRGTEKTATTSYTRLHCQDCGKWMRGKKSLATTNVRNI
jgi:uncharacterized protein YprB with RNaseH-like and TPR domain